MTATKTIDLLELAERRLESWKAADLPGWLQKAAPKVIADIERDIAALRAMEASNEQGDKQ